MSILGVDVGGTFTDFYFLTDSGLQIHKRPSSPSNPAESILEGIAEMGWQPGEVVHGTTVATNTVLERKGAKVAFVTTKGFKDLLQIGRQARPKIYDLEPTRPPLLVPPALCFEVAERVDYEGNVLEPLRSDGIERLLQDLSAARPDAVAVCLLFAHLNPGHERHIGERLRREGFEVVLSSHVLPEPREYERASTTVLSAYVAPRLRGYLSELEAGLAGLGTSHLSIVQSSGGTVTASQARDLAASTLLSGPAAGVSGAVSIGQRVGLQNLITVDIGGTSTDVCLAPGRVPFTNEWSIAGLPVRLPAVDIHTVGAGGGSLAWVDEGGALRVGPSSAGADPGPAAYGRGGPATITDAQLVLGRLDESSFLGGRFAVDAAASRRAMEALDIGSAMEAARGVVSVANTVISAALRVVSVERGFDPTDFAIVAFGGAGPLHACELAEALSMRTVLVPRYPGVLSALGMTASEPMRDYSAPLVTRVEGDGAELHAILEKRLAELSQRARDELGSEAVLEPSVDMRYEGQGYELTVPMLGSDVSALVTGFHEQHRVRYGHDSLQRGVEAVTLRLRARLPKPSQPDVIIGRGGKDPSAAIMSHRRVVIDRPTDVPVLHRDALLAGNEIEGPAIVSQVDSTTFIRPGWRASVQSAGDMLLEKV